MPHRNKLEPRFKFRPAFKVHGGKRYLCTWVIDNFPAGYETMTYLEPYCGGASVLLNKERSSEEAINDLDRGVVRVLRFLRDEPTLFVRKLRRLGYSEQTFLKAKARKPSEDLDGAVAEYVVRRMSRGGLKKAFAWSDRERGGQPGDVNAWETMLDLLPEISGRLQGGERLQQGRPEGDRRLQRPQLPRIL
jgi:hypothetical protein